MSSESSKQSSLKATKKNLAVAKTSQSRAFLGSLFGTIYLVFGSLFGIWMSASFVNYFGIIFTGLIVSLTSLTSLLNIIEGGLGSTFGFFFYKHIVNKDTKNIIHYALFLTYAMRLVGLLLIVGIIIGVPIYGFFIYNSNQLPFNYFFIVLLGVVIASKDIFGYFLCARTIAYLNAKHMQYTISIIDFMWDLVTNLLLIFMFYVFIYFKFDGTIISASGFIIAFFVIYTLKSFGRCFTFWIYEKYFLPELIMCKKMKFSFSRDDWRIIRLFLYSFCNRCMSVFMSEILILIFTIFGFLHLVAIYGIYLLIISAVQNIIFSMSRNVNSVIGQLRYRTSHKKDPKYQDVFDKYHYIFFSINAGAFLICFTFLTTFISTFYGTTLIPINYDITQLNLIFVIYGFAITSASFWQSQAETLGLFKRIAKSSIIHCLLCWFLCLLFVWYLFYNHYQSSIFYILFFISLVYFYRAFDFGFWCHQTKSISIKTTTYIVFLNAFCMFVGMLILRNNFYLFSHPSPGNIFINGIWSVLTAMIWFSLIHIIFAYKYIKTIFGFILFELQRLLSFFLLHLRHKKT